MFTLITGTTNGIGKSITNILLSKNLKVIGIDKKVNRFFKSKKYKNVTGVKYYKGNLKNINFFKWIFLRRY